MIEVRIRDVPDQHVLTEQRTVDQAGLEAWLPGAAYEAVETWARDHGHPVTGGPIEAYWTDFPAAAGDDEVFDVAFPVT